MEDVDLAMELGRMYRGDASQLTPPIPEDVSSVLSRLDNSFASLNGMHDFVCHTPTLRTRPILVAFVAQYPLDRILVLIRDNQERLLTDHWLHEMLGVLEDTFRSQTPVTLAKRFCERLVVGLPISDTIRRAHSRQDNPCFTDCLDRLTFVCATCRDLVRDPFLFRHLSTHMHVVEQRERILYLIEVGEFHEDTRLVENVYEVLVCMMCRRETGDMVIDATERLLRHNAELRTERYLHVASQLWCSGWPVVLGPVIAHLLDTSNVSLVVEWYRSGKLNALIQASQTHTTVEWRAVRGLLRHLVPARVREALRESRPSRTTPLNVTCPITLDHVVNPVVISDGHTYERDAIMRHFAASGFVSPLTRQRVAPYVFTNRVSLC